MRNLILFLAMFFAVGAKAQTDNTTFTFLNGRYLQLINNLSDLTSVPTARINLGLGNVTNESKATMFTSPTFTAPVLGVASGTSLTVTSSLGYSTGAGGTVTQTGTKATGVTLNKISGQITMVNSALAAGSEVKFTVTNSTISATDVPMIAIKSGGTSGSYLISVGAVSAGSFDIVVSNASAGSLSEALVLNFVVIKGVNN